MAKPRSGWHLNGTAPQRNQTKKWLAPQRIRTSTDQDLNGTAPQRITTNKGIRDWPEILAGDEVPNQEVAGTSTDQHLNGSAQPHSDCYGLTPGSAQWYEEGCGDEAEPGTTTSGPSWTFSDGLDLLEEYCADAPLYTHPIQTILALYNNGEIDLATYNSLTETIDSMPITSDPMSWALINWSRLGLMDTANADFWRWFDMCVTVGYIPEAFPGPPEDSGGPEHEV